MLVYRLTNLVTGKIYIGITRHSARKRFRGHVDQSRRPFRNRPILSAIRKYGSECWKVETIATAQTWSELCALETKAIAEFKSSVRSIGYNVSAGGEGAVGVTHTPERRRAASLRMSGRVVSEETRRKISIGNKGKPKSAEHIAKSAAARRGFRKTPEQIEKSAIWHRGKSVSSETRNRLSAALRGNVNGGFQAKPFCGKGHSMAGDNLYIYTIASGKQRKCCRTCMIENNKRQHLRRYPKRQV